MNDWTHAAKAEQARRDGTQDDCGRLLAVVQELSVLRDAADVIQVVRRAARELTGADGVTFVLREGDLVHYAEENAIGPLWKGRRFPASVCISGWAILHRETVVIEDIYADPRIPCDAYRETFVKSLAMVPIRVADPLGAIGAYWATRRRATRREVEMLQSLAGATAVALANAELLAEIRRSVKARDEFIGIASHELKTPLTPLWLQLDGLDRALDRGVDPAVFRGVLQKMRANVQRVARLVDKLLQVSALAQGRLELSRQEVDIAALARGILDGFESELRRTGSAATIRADGAVRVWGDRMRLEQVLTNLISNAVKYGDGKPIDVTIDEDEHRARIVVRDHGIGIAPQDQTRIFERFERAVSARHYGGFGIGLWIVKEVVEAHEGAIRLDSRLGEGATFTVVLPRVTGGTSCAGSS